MHVTASLFSLSSAVDTCEAVTSEAFERVLDNLKLLAQRGKPVEIRILIIPAMNDSVQNLDAVGSLISGMKNITRVKLLPYHDFARSKVNALGIEDTMPHVTPPSVNELA